MPENITAAYIDSELQNIRNQVATKDGRFPHLLLPVRIEARFMKVDKPVLSLQEGQLERQLGQMAELEVDLEKKAPNFSGARLRDFYNEILKRLRKAIRDVRPLPPLTRQQKSGRKNYRLQCWLPLEGS